MSNEDTLHPEAVQPERPSNGTTETLRAQTVLDDSDKAVAVRLKQVGGAGAVTVRVWLPGNMQPLTVSIPPNSQTIIEFAGDVLTLGKHELKAELAGGATPYVRTLTFERIRGPLER